MNVQPDADPDVHRFDVTTRKPISCQRRGCTKLGTVLCAACQQASYCSYTISTRIFEKYVMINHTRSVFFSFLF